MMFQRAPRALALAVLALLIAGIVFVLARSGGSTLPPRAGNARPQLLLLTTLPIVFPEQLTLDAPASPVLAALERRYRVEPISTADAADLRGARLLLMAQPQAQPAGALVDLDRWVRQGGSVLLLADPALAWPSERPLGDMLRPPTTFADTGLLQHWGLRLLGADPSSQPQVKIRGTPVDVRSAGALIAADRRCRISDGGLIARCSIGKGRATVIADADLLRGRDAGDGAGLRKLLLEWLAELERPANLQVSSA
ncbi:hypothetical protein G7078_10045 [Sphingomonas sinipercae]|uniref:DUF4350 domain-containing protein n=1 Tax=Sphingomonas sinipercae TaxID=2714944 RepID=A0A6G7ZQ24_9SPHN|nr:DUF4350 domain-containing protein [Sphingomonas sinipercae]QIL03084.1 hypothetical protein G7078_10045 [Sphingomonas sinipercae]